jgi:prevent-host-death family protein
MIHYRDIHTLAEFKHNSTELLRQLETSCRTQVLTVDGRPKAALVNIEVFERLAEQVENAENLEAIRRGLADVEAGRTMPLAEAEALIRKRLEM